MVDKIDYISVLRNEIAVLKKYYYDETSGGTGHFNTAISVLKQRIVDIEKTIDVKNFNIMIEVKEDGTFVMDREVPPTNGRGLHST